MKAAENHPLYLQDVNRILIQSHTVSADTSYVFIFPRISKLWKTFPKAETSWYWIIFDLYCIFSFHVFLSFQHSLRSSLIVEESPGLYSLEHHPPARRRLRDGQSLWGKDVGSSENINNINIDLVMKPQSLVVNWICPSCQLDSLA